MPDLIASPHFNNLTSSKSNLALSASACCLDISTFALALQISVRLPSSGKLNPIENPAFPLWDWYCDGSPPPFRLPKTKGDKLIVGPWQLTPEPKVFIA